MILIYCKKKKKKKINLLCNLYRKTYDVCNVLTKYLSISFHLSHPVFKSMFSTFSTFFLHCLFSPTYSLSHEVCFPFVMLSFFLPFLYSLSPCLLISQTIKSCHSIAHSLYCSLSRCPFLSLLKFPVSLCIPFLTFLFSIFPLGAIFCSLNIIFLLFSILLNHFHFYSFQAFFFHFYI